MKRSGIKGWHKIVAGALACAMLTATPAYAEWINTDQGPGLAQWVDDQGNVMERPTDQADQAGNAGSQADGPGQGQGLGTEAGGQAGGQGAGAENPAGGQGAGVENPAAGAESLAGSLEASQAGLVQELSGLADQLSANLAEAAGGAAAQQAAGGRYIDPGKPMVALTFDDGPLTSVDNQIMDCLAAYGGKATFFVVGSRVPAHQAALQRMVAEGHQIANHTMNHKYLQKLGADAIRQQVQQCNDVIQSVTGVRPAVMRLPGGGYNNTVLANTNMPMIQWSIDTRDWKTRNAAQTVAAVLNQVKDGDIVLMHDLYSQTGAAAVQIIPALTARGYQLVTVSEMAAAKGTGLEPGKLYSSIR